MPVPIDVTQPQPPVRPDESHKGTFGRVLIVAGSRGMSGAACLSGCGALRGGAGLVQVAVPEEILPIVAASEPSFLTAALPQDAAGRISRQAAREILALADASTSVAIGPGWGRSADLQELVHLLVTTLTKPLVIDADALNALSHAGGFPRPPEGAIRVITPHPGEFSRLLQCDVKTLQADRETIAAEFAAQQKLVVLLKGHRTVVTDGTRAWINGTGNSGMATGGTGDVLTGLVAALLAQGLAAYEAAKLGAHLHGLAGDLAAAEFGKPGLIASDLPRLLGGAWLQLGAG